jgi:hypothetical protein
MEVRLLNGNDYETLSSWWRDWRWTPPPPADMLPENGTGGVMVSKDGVEICAGFVYFTNSKAAWIEFIVSNFQYKENDRHEALEFLINVLIELVKDAGDFKYIYTSLKSKSLIDRYSNCGFIKGDSNCQEMVKIL